MTGKFDRSGKIITRTVILLSLVSLLTDMASEMLYPVMPLYLKQIGFTMLGIGILEGLAEATAGLSKGYFGNLSDYKGKRLPFVQLGYSLSALSKPLMAVFVFPWWILLVRMLDRLGKGIRTGARDAMLAAEGTTATKGSVFGFHRAMDTIGAVLGPGLALIFLYFYPGQYRLLFLIAFLPGLAAILISFLAKDKKQDVPAEFRQAKTPGFFTFLKYWRSATPQFRRLVAGLLVFALFNSSDVFLLLAIKEAGFDDTAVIGIYIFYNLVYAAVAYPAGRLADKIGLKKVFLAGLMLFAFVYSGMTFFVGFWWFAVLFFVYGMYAATTEGISKAWITTICKEHETATAIGSYTAYQSICTLAASSLAGLLWFWYDPQVTFLVSATMAVVVFFYILFFVKK